MFSGKPFWSLGTTAQNALLLYHVVLVRRITNKFLDLHHSVSAGLFLRKMHTGWKVRWAGMVTTSLSQSWTTPQMRGYQASRKQNFGEGRNKFSTRYFIGIALLIIELRKHEVVRNHFIEFFSVRRYVRYQMIANDSPQNCSFSFSYGTIVSQNPANDHLGLNRRISPAASTYR